LFHDRILPTGLRDTFLQPKTAVSDDAPSFRFWYAACSQKLGRTTSTTTTTTIAASLLSLAFPLARQATESSEATDRSLAPAKLTPKLIEKSEAILKEHAVAPLGTDTPLRIHGRRHVARIELHEDDARGKHKGVTVYEVK